MDNNSTELRMLSTYGCKQCHSCPSRFNCNIMVFFVYNGENNKKKKNIFLILNRNKYFGVEEQKRECVKGILIEYKKLTVEAKKRLLVWLNYNYETGEIDADKT